MSIKAALGTSHVIDVKGVLSREMIQVIPPLDYVCTIFHPFSTQQIFAIAKDVPKKIRLHACEGRHQVRLIVET